MKVENKRRSQNLELDDAQRVKRRQTSESESIKFILQPMIDTRSHDPELGASFWIMSVDRLQELDGFTVVLLASLVPSSSKNLTIIRTSRFQEVMTTDLLFDPEVASPGLSERVLGVMLMYAGHVHTR